MDSILFHATPSIPAGQPWASPLALFQCCHWWWFVDKSSSSWVALFEDVRIKGITIVWYCRRAKPANSSGKFQSKTLQLWRTKIEERFHSKRPTRTGLARWGDIKLRHHHNYRRFMSESLQKITFHNCSVSWINIVLVCCSLATQIVKIEWTSEVVNWSAVLIANYALLMR